MTPGRPLNRGMPRRWLQPRKKAVRPLAIFAGIVVVGVILIAVGLRVTNHPASATPPPLPTPLSHAQFVHAANGICERALREGKAKGLRHPNITNLRSLTRDFRLAIPLFIKEAAGVSALVPPRSEAARFRHLVAILGEAQRNAHGILHAVETRQIRRAFLLARQQDVLDKHANAISRKLGLTVCAKS